MYTASRRATSSLNWVRGLDLNRRWKRYFALPWIGGLLVGIQAPTPPAKAHGVDASAATAGTVALQTPSEAFFADIALVAEDRGWTIEEATLSHRSAEAVGAVAERLAESRPDAFVGSIISDDPLAPPALYVKGVADDEIRALVASAGVPVAVVDRQPFSFDELETRKVAVHHALGTLGFKDFATGFKIEGAGVIDATVTRRAGLPSDETAIRAALPAAVRDGVRITVHDHDIVSDTHAYGGMRVSSSTSVCTSGWSVYHPNGTTGVTTAGHCTGIGLHHRA